MAARRPRPCSTASPSCPAARVTHRGQSLDEFDLDAVLARRPALVLVDELAHSNAPGSRHPKRFLDVEELLAAGIDVYTTLNIQHVESLNDVVAQITRIRVRETVPDRILDRADEIELVDLTPDDLMRRLRDGKVYLPHNAERALKHYFSPGNLTALRELALRCTAQRVDRQMLQHMRSQAIRRSLGGERAHPCLRRRTAGLRRAGAPRQAARRPAAGLLDGGARRRRARRQALGGGARPPGGNDPPRPAPRRRDRPPPGDGGRGRG